MNVKTRLVNYYKNNQFIQKYIKGLDPSTNEIVLIYNGKEQNISIDILEKMTDELSLVNYLNQKQTIETPIKQEEIIEEPPVENNETIQPAIVSASVVNDTFEDNLETLNDIKILTELKNKPALDNILRKFAINENTGLIDINKAIDIVEKNTIDAVINSIKENYAFDKDAINYDVQGRFIGEKIPDAISADEKIVTSFNNIKVYLEAVKMYPEQLNYSEENINNKLGEYIQKVKNTLNPSTPAKEEVTSPVAEPINNPIPVSQVTPQPEVANAGFADILVLAVIVIVYAIIIVNLILKLK